MEDVGVFYGHLVYIFYGHFIYIFYGHLVHAFCGNLVYVVVIWYIFLLFGLLYREKSGNPGLEHSCFHFKRWLGLTRTSGPSAVVEARQYFKNGPRSLRKTWSD
jgi:hypothetical protein